MNFLLFVKKLNQDILHLLSSLASVLLLQLVLVKKLSKLKPLLNKEQKKPLTQKEQGLVRLKKQPHKEPKILNQHKKHFLILSKLLLMQSQVKQ